MLTDDRPTLRYLGYRWWPSLVALLFLVCFILKLAGIIDWSWWLVFTPLGVNAVLIAIASFTLMSWWAHGHDI